MKFNHFKLNIGLMALVSLSVTLNAVLVQALTADRLTLACVHVWHGIDFCFGGFVGSVFKLGPLYRLNRLVVYRFCGGIIIVFLLFQYRIFFAKLFLFFCRIPSKKHGKTTLCNCGFTVSVIWF